MTSAIPARLPAWARIGVLALLWGSTFLWIKVALDGFSPVQVTLIRCVLASLTLLVLCYAAGHRLPRGRALWARILVAAFFCNALPFALFSFAEQTVDSGLAGVLNATTPLWALLIGVVAGTERRVPAARSGGLLLGFAGTVLIFAPWRGSAGVGWTALAVVGAAVSYAVGFAYMARHLVGRGHPTIALSAAQMVAASALTALTLPAGGLTPVHAPGTALPAVLVLGVLATGVTFHLTYRVIADEGATNAAAVGYLLPVVSVALGAAALGEHVSLRMAAGMAVVLTAVSLTRRAGKPGCVRRRPLRSVRPWTGTPGTATTTVRNPPSGDGSSSSRSAFARSWTRVRRVRSGSSASAPGRGAM